MIDPNKAHHSGSWRAYIEATPFKREAALFVLQDDHLISISNGAVTSKPLQEGLSLGEQDALFTWHETLDDEITDFWKAVGKALGVYDERPGRAYDLGLAEGRAEVLREWNDHLKSQGKP
jgi:hypothetical protein